MKKPTLKKRTVTCPGCQRQQEIGADKLVKADYYTCSLDCRLNRGWKHPATPEGKIHLIVLNAAAGFVGHEFVVPDDEDIVSLSKGRMIIETNTGEINKNYN
jgi:hypothetical protein